MGASLILQGARLQNVRAVALVDRRVGVHVRQRSAAGVVRGALRYVAVAACTLELAPFLLSAWFLYSTACRNAQNLAWFMGAQVGAGRPLQV